MQTGKNATLAEKQALAEKLNSENFIMSQQPI